MVQQDSINYHLEEGASSGGGKLKVRRLVELLKAAHHKGSPQEERNESSLSIGILREVLDHREDMWS